MRSTRRFVVTGGVGFGKTTLVEAVAQSGKIGAAPEIAREIVRRELTSGGTRLPWQDFLNFERELVERRVALWLGEQPAEVVLYDRGIPDAVGFLRAGGHDVPEFVWDACKRHPYEKTVFLVPPWRDIFVNHPERPQRYDEAVAVGNCLYAAYTELGYEVVTVPIGNIVARVKFVMDRIAADTVGR